MASGRGGTIDGRPLEAAVALSLSVSVPRSQVLRIGPETLSNLQPLYSKELAFTPLETSTPLEAATIL